MASPPSPLGIYLHIPFCHAKCVYCDFFSVAGRDDLVDLYVDGLLAEIKGNAPCGAGREVASIFFGGGTPSLLEPDTVGAIIDTIAGAYRIGGHVEITMEMNPESVDQERAEGWRHAGVNRASLGLQSLDDRALKFLGRIHSADDGRKAFQAITAAGFTNRSCDFIIGAPGQGVADLMTQLREVTGWRPEALSVYELTPEPGTELGREVAAGRIDLGEERLADLFEAAASLLAAFDYHHYEVSNYARQGYQCRHNLGYWRSEEYLGFGAGAHSFFGGERWSNIRSVEGYADRVRRTGAAVEEKERLTPAMIATERLMMGLRLAEGIPVGPSELTEKIRRKMAEGFLSYEGGRLKTTPRGFRLLDPLLASL